MTEGSDYVYDAADLSLVLTDIELDHGQWKFWYDQVGRGVVISGFNANRCESDPARWVVTLYVCPADLSLNAIAYKPKWRWEFSWRWPFVRRVKEIIQHFAGPGATT